MGRKLDDFAGKLLGLLLIVVAFGMMIPMVVLSVEWWGELLGF